MPKFKMKISRSLRRDHCPDHIIMPAGKFRNIPMSLIPSSYLRWVAENWSEDTKRDKEICIAADKVWQWREVNGYHFEEGDRL